MRKMILRSVVLLLMGGGAGQAQNLVDVFIQNATDSPVITPDGNNIASGEVALFRQIPIPEKWNDVFVSGLIQSASEANIKPCQVSFRTYKDLNFHQHIMKTVIFVRHKKDRLVCSPRAVEFDVTGLIRPGGLRLSLQKAYRQIHRAGEIRTGKPHLVYEFERPLIPYLYILPKEEKVKGKGSFRDRKIVRKEIRLLP